MKRICYLLLVLVLAGGCQLPAAKKTSGKVTAPSARSDGDNTDSGEDGTAQSPAPKVNPEALARFATAESLLLNEKFDQAETQYLASVEADPSNEDLAIKLARGFIKDQQPDKAVAILTKPATRTNASTQVMVWLARSLLFSGKTNQALAVCHKVLLKPVETLDGYDFLIETLAKGGQTLEASKALSRLSRNPKADPDYLISLAEIYSIYSKYHPNGRKGVSSQVIEMLDRAAKLDPASGDLLKRMADEYSRFGQPQKAAVFYAKILAGLTRPSGLRDVVREKLANIYLATGDRTNAVKQLKAIVHDSPTGYPAAWYLLGTLAYEDRNLADAGRSFEQAIILEPGLEQAYYDLALVQIDLQHNDEALGTMGKAAGRFPRSFVGEFFSGIINSRLKKYAESVKHFTAAEEIARTGETNHLTKDFYFQFGAASERNHDLKQAAEKFQKCLALDANFAEALNYLGFMWAEQGENLAQARELIEKAVKLDPKNAAYLDSLGWVFFKLNQPGQALPWLLKAQEHSPEPDPTLLDHLGDVYLALHQNEKARQAWEKSLTIEANPEIKKKLSLLLGGNS